MRRDRADGNRRGTQAFRAALVIIGLLQLAAPTRALAQNADLEPRLVEPALWLAIPSEIVSLPAAEQVATERPMSFPVMAGASTLGSAVGAGVGLLMGLQATESLAGVVFAYPGAWLGATLGAHATGAPRKRAFLGSTVGLFLGAAVAAAGGDEWTWAGIGVHGLVTALLSGSVDP